MLGNKKNVFWEALFLTIVVFLFGLLLGVAIEGRRVDNINDYYAQSEIALMDVLAMERLLEVETGTCSDLMESSRNFANRVYEEARTLEKYDESSRLSEGIKLAHQRYDLLRTFLWINSMKIKQKCPGEYNYVVYLYSLEIKDLTNKATQKTWSKILMDLKNDLGEDVILIPIAADQEIDSLELILNEKDIEKFPAVVVNGEEVLYDLKTVDELKDILNNST